MSFSTTFQLIKLAALLAQYWKNYDDQIWQGSPHIVKTGRLDFSLSWLEGEVRENLEDFRKLIQILSFLSHPIQGSPNQSKWATSSPWFHWNCPISVKKQSFSRPVSLFKVSRPKNLTRIFTGYWTDGFSKKYVNLTAVVLAFMEMFVLNLSNLWTFWF
jgi:hypothetical protein